MKRGGPLRRTTGLRRTPMKRAAPKPRSRFTIVRPEVRDDAHSMSWADVRRIIWTRCGGNCEVCGTSITFGRMEGHHRRTRAIGPDCPCNALALCAHCHHAKVHAYPERSRELGRIISRHDRNAASIQPVRLRYGQVLLACDGSLQLAG